MTTLYWFYLVPVLARIIACIGALLVLFACYIYIQFYDYDRCNYYSNTYEKWFYNSINIDKYTKRAGRLIAKDAIKRANRKLIIGFVMIVISFFCCTTTVIFCYWICSLFVCFFFFVNSIQSRAFYLQTR